MSQKKNKGLGQSITARQVKKGGRPRKPARRPRPYSLELRRKVVRLHEEERIPLKLIVAETGLSPETIRQWVKRYRKEGEAGLAVRPGGRSAKARKHGLPPAVHEAIVAVKRENPAFGVRRIAHWLQRSLFMQASPETVRQTLHRHKLPIAKPVKKPKKNPQKPRFFERSTPNQMWQSDIFCFQLNHQNAYLIGFIDDHSRYIVGLGLFRSQTSENVLEVYRRATGEYREPKEMLTDNGRQYVSWHGKTRFQNALARDHVHHIRSAPHHPMTLGKIERFWKTIWAEFLERARFETFEGAVERIAYWVQYYNHKRPHQGIEGLCPAERFFALQKDMRSVRERSIAENVESLALRGKPQEPFYMVGRVGGQNVVLQAERGQVRITVDGKPTQGDQHGQQREGQEGTDGSERTGEMPGGTGDVDGAAASIGNLPGDGHPGEPAVGLAGTGDGGYATSTGAAHAEAGGPGADARPTDGETAGTQDGAAGEPDRTPGGQGASGAGETGGLIEPPRRNGDEGHVGADGEDHHAGAGGCADSHRGRPADEDLPQDLLRTRDKGVSGDGIGVAAGPSGTTAGCQRGDATPAGCTPAVGAGTGGAGATGANPANPGGC